MDSFKFGLFLTVVLLAAAAAASYASQVSGDFQAHREYLACLKARAAVKSDSVTVAVRPECKRWLFPEVQ